MKNDLDSARIKALEAKIDKLQKSVSRLEKTLSDHIEFITSHLGTQYRKLRISLVNSTNAFFYLQSYLISLNNCVC